MKEQADFYWTEAREPHSERRKAILKKYPQVRELVGRDIKLVIGTILLVVLQLSLAYFIDNFSIWILIIVSYFIGSTATHALFLAIHEITHNLAFKKQVHNNWFALFANIPIVFPYSMSFKTYHTMHHRQQGKDGIDVDIPTTAETRIFKGTFGKLIWEVNQIFFYALRPMFVYPIKLKKWHYINIFFQVIAMAVFLPFAGWEGLFYLLLSSFFAGGLNPVSGHFIAEHYVFREGQETYSYYGPLNLLMFNVGYHNEHHDFPSIPGSRLPKLKKIAPEFYDTLYSHKSYTKVILKFITDSAISLHSRIKRK
ncbi:MAG TPA: fatty acid desaturase [Ignavibacteria bacterium]|nr:fatty acid desaturase [Ignavibacteria bacterium]